MLTAIAGQHVPAQIVIKLHQQHHHRAVPDWGGFFVCLFTTFHCPLKLFYSEYLYNLKSTFMIEIFKTNVQNKSQAKQIINLLKNIFSEATINFDLNDCDKILRVAGIKKSYTKTIVTDLNNLGYTCEILN